MVMRQPTYKAASRLYKVVAILLSARPLDLSRPKILSLQIIGYVEVSILLVAMAATVCFS